MKNKKARKLTITAMLAAITILLGLTVGYIPGPVAKLTLMTIPVIIGAILEGFGTGLFLGLIFGLTSVAQMFMFPSVFLPVFQVRPFYMLVILMIPRLLIPMTAYLSYTGMSKLFKDRFLPISTGITAAIGSLTNTVFVLLGVYLLVAPEFANALGTATDTVGAVLLGIAGFNGLIEAAVAVVLCIPIVMALSKFKKRKTEN
jgi:uncharacterized membrane protein